MSRGRAATLARSIAEARDARGLTLAPERPLFEPWERMQILTIVADDLPEGPPYDAFREVLLAACTVVRNYQGSATRTAAYAHIARAQERLRELTRKREET